MMRILVIEDDSNDQDQIRRALDDISRDLADFETPDVHWLDGVGEAELVTLRAHDFDLAIVDWDLPHSHLTGFQALEVLRSRDVFRETNVIIYTGRATEIDHVLEALQH